MTALGYRLLVGDRYTDARVYAKKEPDTWEALWVLIDYGTSRLWVISYGARTERTTLVIPSAAA